MRVLPSSNRMLLRVLVGSLLLSAASVGPADARRVVPPRVPSVRATGVTFSSRVTSSSADKRVRESSSNLSTVRMQDGNIRMDYIEGITPMGQKNGYVIVQGEAGRFVIVNPKDKQAFVMSADGFGSGLGALMNNPMMKVTMTNTSFHFKELGAGETILGYKTRKVRTYYASTIKVRVLMMNNETTVADSSDQWIGNVDIDPRNLESWSKSFSSGVKSTNPELAAELAKYTKEYGRTGLALKTITWSTRTDKKGKVTADTILSEVSDVKTGPIAADVFKIPDGYEITDMSQMMAGMSASIDSAKTADEKKGDKKDVKKDEKGSASDAIKAGLGGIFGKKKPPM